MTRAQPWILALLCAFATFVALSQLRRGPSNHNRRR